MLTDFGLSRFAVPDAKMEEGVGSVSYLAPEIVKYSGYSHSVDTWALGILLYVMLSGCLPFHGSNAVEIIRSIKNDEVTFDDEE